MKNVSNIKILGLDFYKCNCVICENDSKVVVFLCEKNNDITIEICYDRSSIKYNFGIMSYTQPYCFINTNNEEILIDIKNQIIELFDFPFEFIESLLKIKKLNILK